MELYTITTSSVYLAVEYHFPTADGWENFAMGYKEFMYELFDDNVLFLEGL